MAEATKKKTIVKKVVRVQKKSEVPGINTTENKEQCNVQDTIQYTIQDTIQDQDKVQNTVQNTVQNNTTKSKTNLSVKTLNELVNEGKSVEEIAKILEKPEANIRFQMKMSRFNNFSNDKETNVAKLLDENAKKISQKVSSDIKEKNLMDQITKQPYDEDKLLKNIAKIFFLEKIRNDDVKLNELYDKLIFESTLEIKKIV